MVWDGIKRFRCPLRGWLAVLLPEQIGNLPGFGGTRRDVGPHRHDGKMNILRFQYRKKAMRQVKQPGFADAQRQILRVGLSGKHPASQQDRAFSTRGHPRRDRFDGGIYRANIGGEILNEACHRLGLKITVMHGRGVEMGV